MRGGDVFSHLAANWRCFKFSDVFYGIDGTLAAKNDITAKKNAKVGDNRKADKKISTTLGYNRFMIEDAYKVRCRRLLKSNLKTT